MACEKCMYWRLWRRTLYLTPHLATAIDTRLFRLSLRMRERDANAWAFPVVYSSSWCGEFKERAQGIVSSAQTAKPLLTGQHCAAQPQVH